jgi:tRNA(Ile)-lysidine synthase TilS/MesJ
MKSIKENIMLPNEVLQVFTKLSANIFSDTKVLVAVSGGPDSMLTSVLIYKYFLENKFSLNNLFFIHCNHKTRVETDDEEKFIRSFFDGLNLDVCQYT